MKALVNTGVETLTYMDQADPIAKAGEELVRIQYSGICGSDMHAFLGHDARRPSLSTTTTEEEEKREMACAHHGPEMHAYPIRKCLNIGCGQALRQLWRLDLPDPYR